MPSTRKSEAARANGTKSRGPKTAAGLAKSSRNALDHGFTSRSTIILEYESPDEFQETLAEFQATYNPQTAAERDLVDQMVAARWRIRRLWTIETALIDVEICRRQAQVQREYNKIDGGIELALAFRSLADDSRALSLLIRYESRLSRMYDRAYAALRELQRERESKKIPNEPTAIEKSNDPKPLAATQIPETVVDPTALETETRANRPPLDPTGLRNGHFGLDPSPATPEAGPAEAVWSK